MPESLRLYLDQMLQTKVAQVLRQAGYDVLRASEMGQSRADDQEILTPFLQRISPIQIQNHLVILSTNREKWVSTSQK